MSEQMARLQGCEILMLDDEGSDKLVNKYDHKVTIVCGYDPQGMTVRVLHDGAPGGGKANNIDGASDGNRQLEELLVNGSTTTHLPRGNTAHLLIVGGEVVLLRFATRSDCQQFRTLLQKISGKVSSVFNLRTEDSSASQYFQFYGYLSQQQNMMQDFVRTSTYQRAIYSNASDFQGKVVLDVGAGSGESNGSRHPEQSLIHPTYLFLSRYVSLLFYFGLLGDASQAYYRSLLFRPARPRCTRWRPAIWPSTRSSSLAPTI